MLMKLPKDIFEQSFFPADGNDYDDDGYAVTLQPKLANYKARLEYDGAGNANIVITRKKNIAAGVWTNETVLDFCLDNGEINEIDDSLFGARWSE